MSYFNVIFTILPPLVIGIFDQFVSARMLDRYPQLYQLGQQNYFFTPITFFYWVGNAFYHSVVSDLPTPWVYCLTSRRSCLRFRLSSSGTICWRLMARTRDFGSGVRHCISPFCSPSWAKLP